MSQSGGASFGPYQVVRELGRGGIGVVYEAFDPRLRRSVAIKVLRGVAPGDPVLERFRREALAQARLAHENVVPVFEVGVERGLPYLVMELVRGRSLRDELKARGALPAREALALAARIACGVESIHASGIIHRDLKPENVLLDERGTPKVADFGLAKDPVADAASLSKTGALVGTPHSMAPEQVMGQKERISPRTDVWALGVILHELLSAETPFDAPDLVTLLATITTLPPRPLAARDASGRAAARIVERALAKEPEDRFESARAFGEACEAALAAGEPRRGLAGIALALAPVATLALGLAAGFALGGRRSAPVPTATPTPTPLARADEPRTARQLLDLARAALGRKSRDALADLARTPPADETAALVDAGLEALARAPGLDPAALERAAHTDAELDAAALGFLLLDEPGRARAAAVAGEPLGELVRREAPAPPPLEIAPVATWSHGAAATPRLATAGETILGVPLHGGPVRAYSLDGRFVGLADPTFARGRFLASGGARLAWTRPGGVTLAFGGTSRERDEPLAGGPIAFTPRGELVVLETGVERSSFVVLDPERGAVLRRTYAELDPTSVALSRDGQFIAYAGNGPRGAAVAVASLDATEGDTLVRYPTLEPRSGVAWIDGAVAVVDETSTAKGPAAIVLHDPTGTDRARRVAVPGEGLIRAIASSPEQGIFAVARGSRVFVHYAQETLDDLAPPLDTGAPVESLAFARDGEVLLIGRRGAPAVVARLLPADGTVGLDDTIEALFRAACGRAPHLEEKATWVGHAREVRERGRGTGEGQGKSERLLRWYLRRRLAHDAAENHEKGTGEATPVDERLELAGPFTGAEEVVTAAIYLDPRGDRVATSGLDGALRARARDGGLAWQFERDGTLRGLGVLDLPGARGTRVFAWDSDGRDVTVAVVDGDADAEGVTRGPAAISASGPGYDLGALSPLGERVVLASSASVARKVVLLDVPEKTPAGLPIRDGVAGEGPARALAFSPDGATLATALAAGGVALDRPTFASAREGSSEKGRVLAAPPLRALAFAPGGAWIAGIDARAGSVVLVGDGRERPRRWVDLGARARALAFSPDGLLLAVVLDAGELTVRDFPSGDERAHAAGIALPSDPSVAPALAWSADGRRILAGAGPVSELALEREAPGAGDAARLRGLAQEARLVQDADPRRAWALVAAAARAPWRPDDPILDELGPLERRLSAEAHARAWDEVARSIDGPEKARAEKLAATFRAER